MNGTSHIQRRLQVLVVAGVVAAIAVPAALAGGPGLVPSKLGSPDPREGHSQVTSPGMVASKLGSQDPRDTLNDAIGQSSIAARQLGSPDPRDTAGEVLAEQPSIVASRLGTPDTRDAAVSSYDGDFMFRDYFRGTHWNGNEQVQQAASNDGFDWSRLAIGIVVAVCGLLVLTALGIGARQVRHTRAGLGSA